MCTFPLHCKHGFLKNMQDEYIRRPIQSIPSKCKVLNFWLAYALKLNFSNGIDQHTVMCEFCEIFQLANLLNMLLTCFYMVQSKRSILPYISITIKFSFLDLFLLASSLSEEEEIFFRVTLNSHKHLHLD